MEQPVLVIDNYDSFTYNLVHIVAGSGARVIVKRNDELSVAEAIDMDPAGILISPGPGRPESAGISVELIRSAAHIPVLGVCLGHQAIAQAFGAEIVVAEALMHGKTSEIHHDASGVFAGLPNPFTATRYHSLVVRPDSLPDCLRVTATADSDVIMAVTHNDRPIDGIQFHPESILTVAGPRIVKNWLTTLSPAIAESQTR